MRIVDGSEHLLFSRLNLTISVIPTTRYSIVGQRILLFIKRSHNNFLFKQAAGIPLSQVGRGMKGEGRFVLNIQVGLKGTRPTL